MQHEQETEMTTVLPQEPLSYWQQTAPSHTFSTHLPKLADVAVIGGGLLGASACYWLAQAGISVVLLERTMLAAGATGRNGGFISVGPDEAYAEAIARLGHETAQAILHITLENRILLQHVTAQETIACEYREPGRVSLAVTDEQLSTFAQSSFALAQEGIASTVLTREQVQKVLATPLGLDILGGQFVPTVGVVHPVKLVQGLVSAAQRHGAQIATATVFQLSPNGEHICLHTNRGRVNVGRVIVATNAWISDLLPQFTALFTPVRGQVLAYHPLPSIFPTSITVDFAGSEVYWQQAPDGTIVLGGCRAAAPGRDVYVHVSQPTAIVQNALEQVFPHLFPSLSGLRVARRWAGLMAFTPDFLPVVDCVPGLPNVWVVGGFCGHGMPFGLRFGQLLAEAITNPTFPTLLQPFRLARATLQR